MPNSLEAEQSVVGSMIMSKDAIVTASEMLLKEDFYHQQYGIIFETMVELFTEGQPVDLVTLQNRLKEKDVPQEIQSLDFVRTLVTSVPTSANIKYYANIVKENAIKRKLIHVTSATPARNLSRAYSTRQSTMYLSCFPQGRQVTTCQSVL